MFVKGCASIVLLGLLTMCASCDGVKDAYYPTFEAAKTAGAVGPGKWFPEIIPETATNIYVRRDLDSNEFWLRCNLGSTDIEILAHVCEELTAAEIRDVEFTSPGRGVRRGVDWWPKSLNEDSFASTSQQTGQKLYKYFKIIEFATGRQLRIPCFIVIDPTSDVVYTWQSIAPSL